MQLNKIIIWGHELHSHTHSYIHNAFYIALRYLNYNVYWFNTDGINNYPDDKLINFDNSLILLHGTHAQNLPINNTCFYLWHYDESIIINKIYKLPYNHKNINNQKGILISNTLNLQNYTIPCTNKNCCSKPCNDKDENEKAKTRILYNKNIPYYFYSKDYSIIYIPWASDLLPYQIQENIDTLHINKSKNICNFIGMSLPHWNELKIELLKYNIEYQNYGGTFNINSKNNCSIKENINLIKESIIAPALQDTWQINHGYIPCRIFKNISYGKMGITNNKTVNNIFQNKLIYSENINTLIKKGLEFENKSTKYNIIKELMIDVKDKHTYINRIEFIFNFLNKYKNVYINKKN